MMMMLMMIGKRRKTTGRTCSKGVKKPARQECLINWTAHSVDKQRELNNQQRGDSPFKSIYLTNGRENRRLTYLVIIFLGYNFGNCEMRTVSWYNLSSTFVLKLQEFQDEQVSLPPTFSIPIAYAFSEPTQSVRQIRYYDANHTIDPQIVICVSPNITESDLNIVQLLEE